MPGRHAPTDGERALVEPRLPPSLGRAWADHRRATGGVLSGAATGLPVADPPGRFGPWQAVGERSRRGRDDGTWAELL